MEPTRNEIPPNLPIAPEEPEAVVPPPSLPLPPVELPPPPVSVPPPPTFEHLPPVQPSVQTYVRPQSVHHRKLVILLLLCIAVIGIIAGIKLAEERNIPKLSAGVNDGTLNPSQALTVDPSFYQEETSQPTVAKTPPLVVTPAVPPVPSNGVSAQAYLVGNVVTGQVYDERNGTSPLPIASMSKLMTAIVATNTLTPTTTITITPAEASVYPDLSRIGAGEKFTEKEILYPLLLDSSNIAAEALASTTNRANFLNLMNGYAWEIGLPKSYFADPSGLSPLNEASAEGFFALAQYVYKSRPDLLAITRIPTISVATTSDHGAHDFVSIHPFVSDPRFIGGKTGHTPEASDTMLTILNINGQPIAIIVLGSNNRAKDTTVLIDELGKTLAARQ